MGSSQEEIDAILKRAVPILVVVSFVVASARPAMAVNNPATAQLDAGRAAAGNAAGLSPRTAQEDRPEGRAAQTEEEKIVVQPEDIRAGRKDAPQGSRYL